MSRFAAKNRVRVKSKHKSGFSKDPLISYYFSSKGAMRLVTMASLKKMIHRFFTYGVV